MNETMRVSDLGAAAYLLMKDYKPLGRSNREIVFECDGENTSEKFEDLVMDYLASEFHRFDSCLMSLKKIGQTKRKLGPHHRFATDLGAAAYILMHKFKPIGKYDKAIYFDTDESSMKLFDKVALEYLTSDFHAFDSCLMSLKKIGEYHEY